MVISEMASALTTFLSGKAASRVEAHEKGVSVEELLEQKHLQSQGNMKDRSLSSAASNTADAAHAQENRHSTKASCKTEKELTEVLANHAAERAHFQKEYHKLEEKFQKYRKEAQRMKEQQNISHEQQESLRKQTEALEEENEILEHDKQFVASRYKYVVDKTCQPFANAKGLKWNDQTGPTMSVVLDALIADAIEAGTLRDQVHILQKEMLAKLDKVQVISDEQLGREFRNLAALVKTLSRTIQFSPEANIVEHCGTPSLLQGVEQRHWKGRAGKKSLVEAWVWCVLLECVFQNPFAVFGKASSDLNSTWKNIFGSEHAHMWPRPTTLCETWRCTTIEHLSKEVGLTDGVANKSTSDTGAKTLHPSVSEAHNNVYFIIARLVAKITSASESPQIMSIIDMAFALAFQMSIQRFRLQVTHPYAGAAFNKDNMKSLPDPDGEDIEEGSVAFIVHPGLTKWGDAHGKNLDHRFDIVTSLVQLEATKADRGTAKSSTTAEISST